MTELLQIIVLACKISTGSTINLYDEVYKKEINCQKSLIKCMDSKGITDTLLNWSPANLRDCLKERT